MREIPGYVAGGNPQWTAESWLGPQLLASLPIIQDSVRVTDEADVKVPGAVELSIPDTPEWRPVLPSSPLARFGQRLRLRVDVNGTSVPMGWFRLTAAVPSAGVVAVRGVGLLTEVERSRFTWRHDVVGMSVDAACKHIVGGALPVSVALTGAPMGLRVWEAQTSRLEALLEVLDARAGRAYIDDSATLVIAPAWTSATPVATIADGVGGSLVDLGPIPEDRDPFNGYVVSTVPEGDDAPMVESWSVPSGPMRWGGPYGYNPGFLSSPLLPADRGALAHVAETMTRRQMRSAMAVDFVTPLDPRLQVGDAVTIRCARYGIDAPHRITQLAHTRTTTSGRAAQL